ncbi:chemotaxis protein MotC [Rhizobium sp. G187]|uniref:chemotaxis protein MotC n=1 Tax=Rhizobium sp. G187 TaxID=3451352 RepID=UPI003EE4DFB3
MVLRRFSLIALAGCAAALLGSLPAMAQGAEHIEPYRMLRSLQFVQDSVVRGDHSAADMQRFMLGTIDQRLREADPAIFADPRNVDAALIYAMSGGNPQTLEFLVARDVDGHFDNRVADALRKYLSGKGTLISKTLGEILVEYKDTDIAPYLALVAGNVTIALDPAAALKHYDWARLSAPGTIVEEAALRRSLSVAVEAHMVDKAKGYANRYARRFLYSPYASQFADLFVELVVANVGAVQPADIEATLSYMDVDRRREVYLRMARRAAIDGQKDLALLASEQAGKLAGDAAGDDAMAKLYGTLVKVPTEGVGDAIAALTAIPEAALTPRDKALRQAAETIAKEVLRKPEAPQSPPDGAPGAEPAAQDAAATAAAAADPELQDPFAPVAAPDSAPTAEKQAADGAATTPSAEAPQTAAKASAEQAEAPAIDPQLATFLEAGRSKLGAIDDLLEEEGP